MRIGKERIESEVFSLLKAWCDALTGLQLDMPGRGEFDGGLLCPACKIIHGRCHDAVYPMMVMAKRTGEDRYLTAAKKLFQWGENMLCDDGSLYNDGQSDWNGITVFNAMALHDALRRHGRLLDGATRAAWEKRLLAMGEWLHSHLVIGMSTNINYFAANACAMALLGKYFGRADFLALSRSLQAYCLERFTENRLFYGEGKPIDARTPKGCAAIDVGGYNVEESLPALCRCAMELDDGRALEAFRESFRAHLEWMLPDGAWDNSVGTRVFKWTYWGSRTSDGCQEALFRLGREDPVFAEAALRNLRLYARCTKDGLLAGGPDYFRHGEKVCVHHAFCHAKALAGALDEGLYDFERVPLPSDTFQGMKHYPEMDTWRLARGPWRADVTAYDFNYMVGGHASGGALSLLWHEKCGPVVAAGTVDYSLRESHNQQLSLKKAEHLPTCPRLELTENGKRWGQHYDFGAAMTAHEAGGALRVHVGAFLCDDRGRRMDGDGACALDYALTEGELRIAGRVSPRLGGRAEYILPVVAEAARVRVVKGGMKGEPRPLFNLNPGFMGREERVSPDEDGAFEVAVTVG
ncbi:MAG: hypothetical protein IKO07_13690 [Clostridia bacterium]|nr:hypothetical protein [Clostridia bacterium]